MSKDNGGGVKVFWNQLWYETFKALDAKSVKAGATVGVLASVRVACRPDIGRGCAGVRTERRGL